MSDVQTIVKFESLPNEILIQCFEYLNGSDIFYSFDQLNSRVFINLFEIFHYLSILQKFKIQDLLNFV
jgi:hypothetical protein